jgi:hypothetical protein
MLNKEKNIIMHKKKNIVMYNDDYFDVVEFLKETIQKGLETNRINAWDVKVGDLYMFDNKIEYLGVKKNGMFFNTYNHIDYSYVPMMCIKRVETTYGRNLYFIYNGKEFRSREYSLRCCIYKFDPKLVKSIELYSILKNVSGIAGVPNCL